MSDLFIKQIDRLPVYQENILDTNGSYLNLSSLTTGYFIYKPYYSGTPVTGAAELISAASGLLQHSWTSGDVATPGLYMGEWRLSFSSGERTYPMDGFITFEIQPRIS